jgi:hypothetical protein
VVKPRAVDRRIQRTRQLLHGSLMALIQEKGFEALSVQDIIDRAMSAGRRSTPISTARKICSRAASKIYAQR